MNKPMILVAAGLLLVAGVLAIATGFRMSQKPVESAPLVAKPNKGEPPPLQNKQNLPEGWLKDFTLTERSGRKVGTQDWKGKVWAASFFFSKCPGECARQNQAIALVQKEFGPKGVVFVSITCDPDNDTPAVLRDYAKIFTNSSTEWLFLTGDLDYIRRVGAEYFRIAVDKGTHGSRLILVDKWGNPRAYYSTNATSSPVEYAQIRPTLNRLLAETEPPADFAPTAPPAEKTPHPGPDDAPTVDTNDEQPSTDEE